MISAQTITADVVSLRERGEYMGIVGAAVAASLFVLVERRADEPIIPLRLFLDRDSVLTALFGITVGIAMFSTVAYPPTLLQAVNGATATESGLMMLPWWSAYSPAPSRSAASSPPPAATSTSPSSAPPSSQGPGVALPDGRGHPYPYSGLTMLVMGLAWAW